MCTIAIDTCVFEHLLNPQWNTEAHIDALLMNLLKSNHRLLVDEPGRIAREYITMIIPIIRNNAEERAAVLPLLRHWMSQEIRETIAVDRQDALIRHIQSIIIERDELVDQMFVYVACRRGTTLVTNDRQHILSRAGALLRRPRGFREGKVQIQCSRDAATTFSPQEGHN